MHRIKKDALFVIDGSYLLYRSFYGIKPLYTSTGIPTNATYGFIRAIKKIIDQYAPEQCIVAWDSKGPVHRHTKQVPPAPQSQCRLGATSTCVGVHFVQQRNERLPAAADAEHRTSPVVREPLIQDLGGCEQQVWRFLLNLLARENHMPLVGL